MSYFYGQVSGASRASATRRGHRNTGIVARADSYSAGAKVSVEYNEHIDADIVTIYATTGSGDSYGKRLCAFTMKDGAITILDTTHPELFI